MKQAQAASSSLSSPPNGGVPAAKDAFLFYILGIFTGLLGLHNFYAGYKRRGIIQFSVFCLHLTALFYFALFEPLTAARTFVSSPFLLFLPSLFVYCWNLFEVVIVKTDAKGVPFSPAFSSIVKIPLTLPFAALGFHVLLGVVSESVFLVLRAVKIVKFLN